MKTPSLEQLLMISARAEALRAVADHMERGGASVIGRAKLRDLANQIELEAEPDWLRPEASASAREDAAHD